MLPRPPACSCPKNYRYHQSPRTQKLKSANTVFENTHNTVETESPKTLNKTQEAQNRSIECHDESPPKVKEIQDTKNVTRIDEYDITSIYTNTNWTYKFLPKLTNDRRPIWK